MYYQVYEIDNTNVIFMLSYKLDTLTNLKIAI